MATAFGALRRLRSCVYGLPFLQGAPVWRTALPTRAAEQRRRWRGVRSAPLNYFLLFEPWCDALH